MIPMNRYQFEGEGPAAHFARTLQEAGYDVINEREMQWGLAAYNSAMLVCRYHGGGSKDEQAKIARIGRNEPCPCGSGKKHKKCCLITHEARWQTTPGRTPIGLGPNLIPRLANPKAVSEDCAILSRILDRDEDLKQIHFSRESVESFLAKALKNRKPLKDQDHFDEEIDDLAARYLSESGEGKRIEQLEEKLLTAASRVHTEDDLRALATGVCLAWMGKMTEDARDNVLAILIFRRTLSKILVPAFTAGKMIDRLGGDPEEIRRRIESNDPSLFDAIEESWNGLEEWEKQTIESNLEHDQEEVWKVISAGRFPALLPFATLLPFWIPLARMAKDGKQPTREEFQGIIDELADALVEDDYRLYRTLLTRWLDANPDRHDDVARTVDTIAGLCAIHDLDCFIRGLIAYSKGAFAVLDDEEQALIDAWHEPFDDPEFLNQYAAWLRSRGYSQLAERTITLISAESATSTW